MFKNSTVCETLIHHIKFYIRAQANEAIFEYILDKIRIKKPVNSVHETMFLKKFYTVLINTLYR